MKCQSSKFVIISIFTFLFGIGIVQVLPNLAFKKISENQPQLIQNIEPVTENKPINLDFCEEIKKNPNYPNAKPVQGLLMVSGGILNQRVCGSFPNREFDIKTREWTKDYVMIQVTVDENGFVISACVTTNPKFGKRFEKIAKGLRVRPMVLSGIHVKVTGVLIFDSKVKYSNP